MTKYHLTTLGCPKNTVDSEKIATSLENDSVEQTQNVEDADIVVVNTCAFIESAREESIDTVLALSDVKNPNAKLVVTGCMAQRYGDELAQALPEADLVIGFDGASHIVNNLQLGSATDAQKPNNLQLIQLTNKKTNPRPKGVKDLLDLPRNNPDKPWAYLKLAEGCNRSCAFCAIPTFRGKQQSRSIDSIVEEARNLVVGGTRELVLISQDIAWYGRDVETTNQLQPNLSELIKQLDQIGTDELPWLRVLYLYPSEIKGELLETMLTTKSVVPYFDLSLQHASQPLLKSMNRWGSTEKYMKFIDQIRKEKPEVSFRSSFITGFPGETQDDHKQLLEFIAEAQLDWAGFFPYSKEEGTKAFNYENQLPQTLINERYNELVSLQQDINEKVRQRHIGKKLPVLITENEDGELLGRSYHESPEVDGCVIVDNPENKPATIGDVVQVEIDGVLGVDLVGTID